MEFWIARDKGKWGNKRIYFSKPTHHLDGHFEASVCDPYYIPIKDSEYPEVTYENSPHKARLELVKDK